MAKESPHSASWGCGLGAIGLAAWGLLAHHYWLTFTLVSIGVAGALFRLLLPGRSLPGPQPTILAAPAVNDLPDTLVALSTIGLEVDTAATTALLTTELALLRTVPLELDHYDVITGVERIKKATGGLLTTADLLPLRYDIEMRGVDRLPFLNSQMDLTKGRFYYTPEQDYRQVVFLTPLQAQALSARGWSFRVPPPVS
jgi:hypothetical protein